MIAGHARLPDTLIARYARFPDRKPAAPDDCRNRLLNCMEITRPLPSPNPVEQTDAALLQTAEEVSDAVFRSVPVPPLMREHFWVQSSVFAGCIFPAPVLQASHFTDVTFRNCDLSNADLSGCSFQRVEFVECKLVGANLSEGTWQHVVFERCKMEFANFTLGKFRGVRFAGGTMRSVGFDECRFERVEFSLCDLTMAEFSRTRLKGLSFVDSDIRGIRVGDTGSFELKGLKVSALQASELARLLGLEIEE